MFTHKRLVIVGAVALIACSVILVFPVRRFVQLGLDYRKREQEVLETYNRITFHWQGIELFMRKTKVESPAAGTNCAAITYESVNGSDNDFSIIKDYYRAQFLEFNWHETRNETDKISFEINGHLGISVTEYTVQIHGFISEENYNYYSKHFRTIYGIHISSISPLLCSE